MFRKVRTVFIKREGQPQRPIWVHTMHDQNDWVSLSKLMNAYLRKLHLSETGKKVRFSDCIHDSKNHRVSLTIAGELIYLEYHDMETSYSMEKHLHDFIGP